MYQSSGTSDCEESTSSGGCQHSSARSHPADASLTDGVSMLYLPSSSPVYARCSNSSSCRRCAARLFEVLNSQIFATPGSSLRMRSHSASVSESGRPRCSSASNAILR